MSDLTNSLTPLALVTLFVLGSIIFLVGRFDRSGGNRIFYTVLLGLVGVIAIAFLT